MSNESKYADTLNALDEMQKSIAYAARRSVLADAERIIEKLEKNLDKANTAISILRDGVNRVVAAEIQDHPRLDSLTILGKIQAIGESHAELRKMIIPWRYGGARGAKEPAFEEGEELLMFVDPDLSVEEGDGFIEINEVEGIPGNYKFVDADCGRFRFWDEVKYWCPLSALSVPEGSP